MTGRAESFLRDGALFGLLVFAALAPIRSYDYFWHLATGRWIVEHRALPLHDPFGVAADRAPWINGEWLFETAAYGLQTTLGDQGVGAVRSLIVGFVFLMLWRVTSRRGSPSFAFLVVALAFAGAVGRLDARPSTIAAVLLVAALLLVRMRPSWRRDAAFAAVTIVWINVHPSALIAPVVAGVVAVLASPATSSLAVRFRIVAMSLVSLLVNPYGAEAIAAPLRLAAFARGGAFVNAEWLPSSPSIFPLLYASVAVGLLCYAITRRWRSEMPSIFLFLFFAALAIRFVRNQGLYFASFPLLVPVIDREAITAPIRRLVAGAAILLLGWVAAADTHRPGVDASRFPVAAVNRLRSYGLKGNIYDPDQFGGYLIWRFYPERRVLTDGRNELYHTYIAQYARARLDGRAWHALLDQYDVALAVDEYHRERLTVTDAATGSTRALPASQIYFPRKQWALIAFDDAGMVFARRSRFGSEVLRPLEYRVLVPDDQEGFGITPASGPAAVLEVQRALHEIGVRPITARMASVVSGRYGPSQ